MDSGMVVEQERRPSFDPLTPLLPRELCWILDRSFACEVIDLTHCVLIFLFICRVCLLFQMEWHAGNTLSQTVYTLLYVHHLANIDPDLVQYPQQGQALRDFEGLTTIVLRSAVVALLKCCDLTWRELSKGKVHEVRLIHFETSNDFY